MWWGIQKIRSERSGASICSSECLEGKMWDWGSKKSVVCGQACLIYCRARVSGARCKLGCSAAAGRAFAKAWPAIRDGFAGPIKTKLKTPVLNAACDVIGIVHASFFNWNRLISTCLFSEQTGNFLVQQSSK